MSRADFLKDSFLERVDENGQASGAVFHIGTLHVSSIRF